ncbi:hypothetical protein [Hymenobacter armeniacus]|uniref:Uncharacterized protein n=1 Tax=Hymenobacter armeniacus TaxID=2771358 RepID=A0ABR8JYQ9_9BACT|nr:hypothetical protein [Hymenobacter armeniacus]MBD2724153.1 hypothetical protein [Hymenobacter armeniacus]
MNKSIFGLLLTLVLGSFSACKESSKIPAPEVISTPLIFAKVSSDINKSYYNTRRAAASINNLPNTISGTDPNDPFKGQRPVFEFSFDIPDQRDVRIKTVEVYKSFKRGNSIGPRVLHGSYSSFPVTVSVNSQDALTGLKRLLTVTGAALPSTANLLGASNSQANSIVSGDIIVFTFEYVLEDGSRVILTPLTSVKLADGTTVQVISGTQINPPYAVYATFQVL